MHAAHCGLGAALAVDPAHLPGLRIVALTAPYFHNGRVAMRQEAVDWMLEYGLGRAAPQEDKEPIVRLPTTLSGARLPPAGAAP